jgi:hypothetical protein
MVAANRMLIAAPSSHKTQRRELAASITARTSIRVSRLGHR